MRQKFDTKIQSISERIKSNMEKDKRQGWLKELKVGDEVFIIGMFDNRIATVEKITQTGRINAGGYQFNNYGRCALSNYRALHLKELTPELKSKYLLSRKKDNLVQKINNTIKNTNLSELSLEKLERLDAFLKEI